MMTEYVKAWQCIGCGSVEAPQTCIGVCEHRKVQFVYAHHHESVLRELAEARKDVARLQAFVQRIAHITPHEDAWETSYRALQREAVRLVGARMRKGVQRTRVDSPSARSRTHALAE